MKKLATLLLASLLVAGFSTGCKDKKTEEAAPAAEQKEEKQQPVVEEEVVEEEEEAPSEDEAADDEEAEVDEAMFIKAAYEVSCVKAKIDNPEEQKEILEVIYPRYGFETVEDYQSAESALKDSTSVKAALDSKMEKCTVEAAKGFKTSGAKEEEAAEEEAKEDAPAKKEAPKAAYKDGNFKGGISSSDIQNGQVSCSALKGTIRCNVVGKSEGKAFSIPAQGKINSRTGSYTASGSAAGNSVSISGSLKGSGGSGSLKLSVFKRDYNATWSAK